MAFILVKLTKATRQSLVVRRHVFRHVLQTPLGKEQCAHFSPSAVRPKPAYLAFLTPIPSSTPPPLRPLYPSISSTATPLPVTPPPPPPPSSLWVKFCSLIREFISSIIRKFISAWAGISLPEYRKYLSILGALSGIIGLLMSLRKDFFERQHVVVREIKNCFEIQKQEINQSISSLQESISSLQKYFEVRDQEEIKRRELLLHSIKQRQNERRLIWKWMGVSGEVKKPKNGN